MSDDQGGDEDPQWDLKYRSEEEMDFFTEMALHETERWMEAVTRQKFQYPDDPRKSLESGILLCELLNCLKIGSIKKINQFSTPLAGLDNINIFLEVCRTTFGLTNAQLFDAGDLEDLSQRAIADESNQLKEENDRRLRNVAVTIYWLGRVASASDFEGPQLDFNAFSGLFEHHHVNLIPEKTSVYSSFWENNKRLQSNHSTKSGTIHGENSSKELEDQHAGDSSYESIGSKGSDDCQSVGSVDGMLLKSDMYQFGGSMSSLNKANKVYSGNLENDMYQSSPNIYQGSHRSSSSMDSADGMSVGGHSRQSSGSTENYPTRSLGQRTLSASVDPLQFVKPRENTLAKKAEHQLKIATENREAKTPVVLDKEEDWQNNLKSWKSRRRQSYHRSFDQDEMKDEPVKRSTKTYKEMVAEREKRRSLKIPFYAEEEWQDTNIRNTQSLSEEYTRTSLSSESGNSTGGRKEDDDVFDERRSRASSENLGPVESKPEKQEVNNNDASGNNNNSNNNTNNNNSNNIDSKQEKTSPLPKSEPRDIVLQQNADVEENFLKPTNNLDLQSQNASVTMSSARSEKTTSKTDKASKVDSFEAQEEWVQIEGEDFVERKIKISQGLKNEKGFGFLIKGGFDQKTPITVHRIQLGSAADVCDLRCNDIIMSINKVDVRQFTQQKAQQQIDRAVQLGQIELRVRRYFRGGASNNGESWDLMSDKDEPEPEHIPRSRRSKYPDSAVVQGETSPPSPPPQQNKLQLHTETSRDLQSAQPIFPDVIPPPVSEGMSLPNASPDEISPPPPPPPPAQSDEDHSSDLQSNQYNKNIPEPKEINFPKEKERNKIENENHMPVSTPFSILDKAPTPVVPQQIANSESVSSSPTIQPPALLLRWQSRSRSEESKASAEKPSPELGSSANASSSSFSKEPRRRSFFQNEKLYGLDTTKKRSENRFIVRDIRQSLESEKNSIFLNPVEAQVSHSNIVNSKRVVPLGPDKPTEISTSHIDVKSTPLVIQIPSENNSDSLLQIDLNNQRLIQQQQQDGSTHLSTHLPEYLFQVDLNKEPVENEVESRITFTTESATKLEEEEEKKKLEAAKREELKMAEEKRIAEERHLIEQEKQKRLEEERIRQESLEKQRFEKKKEQIRLEEEKLAQKKRELELVQQEIEENRRRLQQEEELINQRKLEQEQQLRMKEEQLKKEEQHRLHQQNEQMRLLEEEKVRFKQLQKQVGIPVQHPQQYQPPSQAFQPAVSVETPKVSQTVQYHQSHTSSQPTRNTVAALSKAYSSVPISHQKKPVLSGKMESVISRFDKPEEDVRPSSKLTREDLLAMNRKATPLQQKPEISPTSSQRMSPISREPPSKTELHSLNAVPRAKHRDPKEWIVSDRTNELEKRSASKSQPLRVPMLRQQEIQSGSQVHWVIEEAERRRHAEMRNPQSKPINDDYPKSANYPIQPADSPNIWRDLPSAPTQKSYNQHLPKNPAYERPSKGSPNGSVCPSVSLETLNQANPRASFASYGSSMSPRSLGSPSNVRTPDSYGDNNTVSEGYESLSGVDSVSPRSSGSLSNQMIDSNSNRMIISHQREDSASSRHSGKSAASSGSDFNEQVAVCGTEKCSHCSQELGFGAAMVIESLSLYYHVKCFRCCVCSIQLGNGSQGADVRVRGQKLHCHNCYSNDEDLKDSVHFIDVLSPDSIAVMTTLQ